MIQLSNFKVKIAGKGGGGRLSLSEVSEEARPLPPLIGVPNEAKSDVLSVSEFAEEAGISPQGVRKMIAEGRLQSHKVGNQHVVPRSALNRYLQIR